MGAASRSRFAFFSFFGFEAGAAVVASAAFESALTFFAFGFLSPPGETNPAGEGSASLPCLLRFFGLSFKFETTITSESFGFGAACEVDEARVEGAISFGIRPERGT